MPAVDFIHDAPFEDCPECGGEGVDADPYGLFDFSVIKPCPHCAEYRDKAEAEGKST